MLHATWRQVVSVVNVSVLLAAEQHNHPHDAIFLPNGDMLVATWYPYTVCGHPRTPRAPHPLPSTSDFGMPRSLRVYYTALPLLFARASRLQRPSMLCNAVGGGRVLLHCIAIPVISV